MRSVLRDGKSPPCSRVLGRALAEELDAVLAPAEDASDEEDAEADTGQEQGDPDDDPEQGDVLCEVACVERGRECRLRDPDLPDRVVERLTVPPRQRVALVVGALAVCGGEAWQLRVGQSAGRLEGM